MESKDQSTSSVVNSGNEIVRIDRNWIVLAILAALVSYGFFEIVRPFLEALILAAISVELIRPFYGYIFKHVGERKNLASALTVFIGLILVILPLIGIGYLAVQQSAGILNNADQIYDSLTENVDALNDGTIDLPDWMPLQSDIANAGPNIVEKVGEIARSVATFLGSHLSGLASGTVLFFLNLFTFLFAIFVFLPMNKSVFKQLLAATGLRSDLQDTIDTRIVSISRATIKGSLILGGIQGILGGIGFYFAGIEGAAFWAVIMVVAAAIPGFGATFVVFCGAAYLAIQGDLPEAIGLALWGGLVVGTIDNLLRPKLVGREVQMSDLMIFISTLGGLAAFGATGLIFGPVLAGLFVTIWKIILGETTTNAKGN